MAEFTAGTVAAALRKVALEMAARPWTTSVEAAFLDLAVELERRGAALDPEPYIYLRTGDGKRLAYDMRHFVDPGQLSFRPRAEYEQDEGAYK